MKTNDFSLSEDWVGPRRCIICLNCGNNLAQAPKSSWKDVEAYKEAGNNCPACQRLIDSLSEEHATHLVKIVDHKIETVRAQLTKDLEDFKDRLRETTRW